MLSAEELRLWEHLCSSKLGELLATAPHLRRTRPLLEDDLVTAIAALQESTAATEQRTLLLQSHRQQQHAQHAFKCLQQSSKRAAQDPVYPIRSKDAFELQQLHFAWAEEVPALTSSINSALSDVLQTRQTAKRQLAQRLGLDDEELRALQKIAPRSCGVADSETTLEWKGSQLVKKLVAFTCEQVQCYLDRIYLEQLGPPLRHEIGVEDDPSHAECSVTTDLDSLYAEVHDVVAMSSAHEFEYPIIKSLQEDRRQHHIREKLSYQSMLATLSRSSQSLEDATNSLESFDSYRRSLDDIHAIYQGILAAVELTAEHESLSASGDDETVPNEAASRALLQHVGMSYDSSTIRKSMEPDLLKLLSKLRIPTPLGPSSINASIRSILDVHNASSELLSLASQEHLQTPAAPTLDTSLRDLDNRLGLLKEKAENLELGRVAESSQAQSHFLDMWA